MHAFASLLTNQRGTQARDLASPPKSEKEPKHERDVYSCMPLHPF